MGGINWAGLDIVIAKLGIEDVEDLMDRLMIIKTHTPPKAGEMPET